MGRYLPKSHMFSIGMGGRDVVVREEWLHTLGPVTMDFKDLSTRFTKEGKNLP
jgi:hypothetical protein